MADRAVRSENEKDEVIDLSNDERWQARLEEARTRRAEALKKKGQEDAPVRRPRKPWEDELDAKAPLPDPIIFDEDDDDDGFDFYDRLDALKKATEKKAAPAAKQTAKLNEQDAPERPDSNYHPVMRNAGMVGLPPKKATKAPEEKPKAEASVPATPAPKAEHAPVDSFFEEMSASGRVQSDSADVEEQPVSILLNVEPKRAPEAPSRPWLNDRDDEEEERAAKRVHLQPQTEEEPAKKGFRGGWLVVGLMALAIGPVITLGPSWISGATFDAGPYFATEPALGVPAAFVEFPVETVSGEWTPMTKRAPGGPLAKTPQVPPAFATSVAALVFVPASDLAPDMPASKARPYDIAPGGRTEPVALPYNISMTDRIGSDPTAFVALPAVLAGVHPNSIYPSQRPEELPLTQ